MLLRFGPHFLIDCLSIILIDLLLAGDNALVIAMAVRSLPRRQRRASIVAGAALAVVLRVAITFVAAQLLTVEFLKLAGGLFVLWIAVRVLVDSSGEDAAGAKPRHLWQAIWFIVLADLTMSTDNILAVAGASKGNGALIVFGLCVSIPFVIFSSNLLSVLMDRYPVLIYLGAAILGKVAAEMILTDGFVAHALHPTAVARYAAEAALALVTVLAGRLLSTARAVDPAA